MDLIKAIHEKLETSDKVESMRTRLGASEIGDTCDRKLWYSLHMAWKASFSASSIMNRADGNRCETAMAEILASLPGVKFSNIDRYTGEQHSRLIFNGLFGGSADGFIEIDLDEGQKWYVWEHKAVSKGKIKTIEKNLAKKGLDYLFPTYYAQAQVYMHLFDLPRHLTTISTPGLRAITYHITEYNKEDAEGFIDRARIIISSTEVPIGVGQSRDYWECSDGLCGYSSVCYGDVVPLANCRTCKYHQFSLKSEGQNFCTMHSAVIPDEFLSQGCPSHIYSNALLPDGVSCISTDDEYSVFIDQDDNSIKNGSAGTTSKEMEGRRWRELFSPEVAEIKKPLEGPFSLSPQTNGETTTEDKASPYKKLVENAVSSYVQKQAQPLVSGVAKKNPSKNRTTRTGSRKSKRLGPPREDFDDDIPF